MLAASFGRRESTDYEFLLQPGFDLKPVGRSLTRPVDTVFALGYYSLHPLFLRELKERLTFGFDQLTKLGYQAPA
jgi:hypothetical protein